MEKMKLKGEWHFIFDSRKEFEDYFTAHVGVVPPLVTNWKEGREGDWVVADDGGVVQILRYAETKKKKVLSKAWVRTIVGTFWINKYDKMDTDINLRQYPAGRYRFSGDNLKSTERVRNRTYLTKQERVFAFLLMTGKNTPEEAYLKSHKYNGPEEKLKEKSWFLFKQERIMNQVREDIKKAAEEAGLSQVDVFRYTKRFIEDEKLPAHLRYNALTDLAVYLDVKTEKPVTTSGFGGFFGGVQSRSIERRLEQIDAETHDKITGANIDIEDTEGEDL